MHRQNIFWVKIANYAIFDSFMVLRCDKMNNARKKVLFVVGGFFVMTLVILLIIYIINNQNRNNIPEISDSSNLSLVVKEQISDALKKLIANLKQKTWEN